MTPNTEKTLGHCLVPALLACSSLLIASGCVSTQGPSAEATYQRTVCTPVVGHRSGERGWFYPFTPFAGVYTGQRTGGWLFPLFSCERDTKTGTRKGLFLGWGHYWKKGNRGAAAMFPLFRYVNDGPVASAAVGRYGTDLKCLLISRYKHQSFVDPAGRKSQVKECSVWPLYRYVHKFSPGTGKTIRKRLAIGWRLFRYERSTDGIRIHILFIPVVKPR